MTCYIRLMRTIPIVLIVGLVAGCAHSGPDYKERAEWNPPARYDHAYAGELTEYAVPQREVVALCRKLKAEAGAPDTVTDNHRGCSFPDMANNRCTIVYISEPFNGTMPTAVRRHELGHCNGWPVSHPA